MLHSLIIHVPPEVTLYMFGVLVFATALAASIALHEFGHFYFARRFGCRVPEFMIGFGPSLWTARRGETIYGLKLLPLGGFVRIIGMYPPAQHRTLTARRARLARVAAKSYTLSLMAGFVRHVRAAEHKLITPEDEDRLFYKLPAHRKIIVMAAGPAVNLVLAFACFLSVFAIHGVYSTEPTGSTVVDHVSACVSSDVIADAESADSPAVDAIVCTPGDPVTAAAAAGIEVGDRIIAVDGLAVGSWDQLQAYVRDHGDETVVFEVERDGQSLQLPPVVLPALERNIGTDDAPQIQTVGYLGVAPESRQVHTRHGVVYTLEQMASMTSHAAQTIAQLPVKVYNVALAIMDIEERDETGPMSVVGASRLAGEVTASTDASLDLSSKAAMLVLVIGSFNLFLGVFNLVPLLPLDGGHILSTVVEAARRGFSRLRGREDPGYIDTAKQMPVALTLAVTFAVMAVILIVGDVVVPLSTGL